MGSNTARAGTPYTAQQLIPHPKYTGAPYDNDIALILLDDEIPANLGTAMKFVDEKFISENKTGTVYGWGATEKGQSSQQLREAKVTIVPKESCGALTYARDYGGVERKTQICAPIKNRRSQQFGKGDSGGPLLYNFRQFGIVSNDFELLVEPQPKTFDLFTELVKFLRWVKTTKKNNYVAPVTPPGVEDNAD